MKRRAKLGIYKRRDGHYQVVLKAGNGESLVWSEGYSRKRDADRALVGILRAAIEALKVA